MQWEDVFQIIVAAIASVGGGGAIVFALSNWLGKVWANRILEADRAKYQLEIERLSRYSGHQFELYNDIWLSLCDLRETADQLWRRATEAEAKLLAEQLETTSHKLSRGRLLIEDDHYDSLTDLFTRFRNFQVGKQLLVDLREEDAPSNEIDHQIQATIGNNRDLRQEYIDLMDEVADSFKEQLGGTL